MAKTGRAPKTAATPRHPAGQAVTHTFLEERARSFDSDSFNAVRQNAMAETDAAKLILNQRVAMSVDRNFSTRLDDWLPTDQKVSGR